MSVRGIRGAISVKKNDKDDIVAATMSLLEKMLSENSIKVEDIATAMFSVTKDLNAEFPAVAARRLGWLYIPLMCTYEIDVPGSLKKCIRILLLANTDKKQKHIKHIYLGEAKKLRPDLESKEKGLYYQS
ncbi:chorismate mutase [Candidatus Margulisiibacteriota bacterium]